MGKITYIFIENLLLGTLIVLLLIYLDRMSASPLLAIFNRWVRWIVLSFGIPFILSNFNWVARPYWVLVAFCFLLWFLLETIYYWLAIAAMSRSEVSLFPKYANNDSGDEWPAQRRYIGLREWIRKNGFKRLRAIKAEFSGEYVLRMSVYENRNKTLRLQIIFLPHRTGNVSVSFNLVSLSKDNARLITDNFFLPYGGFYPENWSVERKPWMRSLPRLLRYHRKRMERAGKKFLPWKDDPLDDLNDQNRTLERINTDMGILFPRHLHEEFGRITWEGRYRFWKELWLLNYFGLVFIH